MALGGVLAALAVAVMSMGTLIPVATYVCPMICCLILQLILKICGEKIAWSWYGAVSILSLLMVPDKEAAAVFPALGYYPILKPKIETMKGKWLWKLAVFNSSMVLLYAILIRIMGITEITGESEELAGIMLMILLILGNVTFLALDRLLTILQMRLRRGR